MPLELLDYQVNQASKVLLEFADSMEQKEFKEYKGFKELLVHKEYQEIAVVFHFHTLLRIT